MDPQGNISSGNNDGVRADGRPNPVTYLADAQAPRLLGADSRDGNAITVTLSESVVPDGGDPADWQIVGPGGAAIAVTGVSGTGATRRLTPTAPDGSTVSYVGTRYTDAAGNVLGRASVPLAAVAVPTITVPAGKTYVSAASATVAGTSQAGVLEVYRDTNGDGLPDGPALTTAQTGGGGFSIAVPLSADGSYDLLVVLVTAQGRSPVARVPQVVRDTVAPTLTLTSPAGGEKLAGGSSQTARYSYSDTNPGTVRLELTVNDGASYTALSVGAPSGSTGYTLPRIDTESARVRATGVDLAGNATSVLSPVFVIDATPPRFLARTVDSRTVRVRLSETQVTGSSSALEWTIKGSRASQVSQSTEGGFVVVTLTTAPGVLIGPDEQPTVVYSPSMLSQPYRDRAGQAVANPTVVAEDGILPAAPSISAPLQPVLTRETTQRVTGAGTVGDRVQLVDPFGARVAGPVTVGPDGTWALDAALPRDSVNDLRAQSLDAHDNRSASAAPIARIEQDGTDPAVSVSEPRAGTRVEPGQQVTVRWTSADRNLLFGRTLVEASIDGGTTFTTIAEQQAPSGSLVWTAPATVTPRALLRVSTPDAAGRTGRASSGLFGIGTAAQAPPSASPSASPSGSPTASATPSGSPLPSVPPIGPLTVTAPKGSIVPGQLADIVVSGDPGTKIELQAYSRPVTKYGRVRTGTLGPDGRLVLPVRPGTNTRLFARLLDGDSSSNSDSVVVNVRTALSLTVVRNGRRDYTFKGRVLPRRSGQLITLYRITDDGRRVITTQIKTDSTGTYTIRRVFTGSGRFGFLTRTGQNLTNAAGESNEGKARPTDIF